MKMEPMHNFKRWIMYWIQLFESIIGILGLGLIHPPSWTLAFLKWDIERQYEKAKAKEARDNL